MENYSYSSYPDSGHSSPRSREIDCENASWDEPPNSNYKVKFMCSYGGTIHPRPHDNQLAYVGGETKILAVDRSIRFSGFISKLSSLCDADVCFKYQLPGEDLDALISVTNDEDLEHMMLEYDRMYRASVKPARLRLFLFPLNPPTSFGSNDAKSERQWFVDALNSVQISPLETSSTPDAAAASAANPDYLFGFDKGQAPPATVAKLQDPPPAPTVPEVFPKETYAGSDCGSEDRHVIGDPAEIQRQIQELQRMQIASHEQAMFHRKSDETNTRAYTGDYYAQKAPERGPPAQPVTIPAAYWQERHMTTGGSGYPVAAAAPGAEPPVYFIPTPAGMYQAPAFRPVTGQVGQPYYGMQRVGPEFYREQPVYNAVPQQSVQQQKFGGYTEAIGMVRPPAGGGAGVGEQGYVQVSYDGAGRQVYYTAPGGAMPPYQAVDVRQGGGALNQEGKVVAKPSQPSSG
uniref:PB1 domain-containing protein n=1 Tax=Davidia involucrata TaxID=16924 RepID=A0A5B7C4X7_DAVIN